MLVIAHRGASGLAPENTLAAMEKALELGACAIELDVHRVEQELVVIHDRWLQRHTDGHGLVHQSTLAHLAGLDAGNGERVPTLWQVLELIAGRCDLNIELKGRGTGELLAPMLERAIAELGYSREQFLVSSFNHPQLARIKASLPWLKIGALTTSCPLNYARFADELGAFSVHMDVNFAEPEFISDAKRRGLRVYVFTVDEAEDILELQLLGVDGVFCNWPDKARSIIGNDQRGPGEAWQ
ncbi:glycerophosphodiester phosphodiesterase [Ferrimonas sediminicola]|uniref:Glycerophosphodiester phosphodiesterase n=1 Tax=Ferrimonas sediminicola TaxID=2569538 RepID=A0A4U1BIY8_9GAMM|nr:glycerophosphodiester phosphodiesterase family protein [Ferrimonas sediminicola]TKB51369.1 glycerophosphodiester phosphodiesterase [Ferrimonas sediminicola]